MKSLHRYISDELVFRQIAEPELSKNLISAVTAPLSTSVMPLQYLDEQAKDLSAKVLDQAKRDIIEHSVQ